MNHGRTVRSETTLFLRQDPNALAVLTEAANDDLQQYLAGGRHERDYIIVDYFDTLLSLDECVGWINHSREGRGHAAPVWVVVARLMDFAAEHS